MNELKPCPFCGGEAELTSGSTSAVACSKCNVHTSFITNIYGEDTTQRAIDRWNTRADGWISVDERLPEADFAAIYDVDSEYPSYIVMIEGATVPTNLYFDGEDWSEEQDMCGEKYRVTHWMPLPEPPKEERI